jgi:hypothetical protein
MFLTTMTLMDRLSLSKPMSHVSFGQTFFAGGSWSAAYVDVVKIQCFHHYCKLPPGHISPKADNEE